MDSPLPRSRFGLDLLIAEAKRRMRRRRVLVGLAAVAAAAAVLLAWQPWSGGDVVGVAAVSRTAIARIPGMTRVISQPFGHTSRVGCPGMWQRGHRPPGCLTYKLRGSRYEAWILTTAYERGFRLEVNTNFARAHPGPVIVTDEWVRLASPAQAKRVLHDSDITLWPDRPAAAVNGGVARTIDWYSGRALSPDTGIQFAWTSGASVVRVNVYGARLTTAEARQIALLARPPLTTA